jgi:hypothetical protein
LLFGAKRNAVLELSEVQRYGTDSYGDADYVSIYGMRPRDWHAKGVRVLGRTAVECTRDGLGDAIGKDLAVIAATCPNTSGMLVVDPFVGSANTLYWLLRHLASARGVGFESDIGIFRLTRQNIAALGLPIDILNLDCLSGLTGVSVASGELLITFIAPPWGNAFDSTCGLDLQRTSPPHNGHRGFPAAQVLPEPSSLCHSGLRDSRSCLYAGGESAIRLVDSANLRTECAGAEPRDSSRYQGLGAGEQITGGL